MTTAVQLDEIESKLNLLSVEMKTIGRRMTRRVRDNAIDRREIARLRAKCERLRLKRVFKVPYGVRLASDAKQGTPKAAINDRCGTVTNLRKASAVVDFGSAGIWIIPIRELIASTELGSGT